MIRHKFNAKPCVENDIKFPSKKERKRYLELKLLQSHGAVLFFLMQAPFYLEGGIIWRADFIVFWKEGDVTVEDVKGMKTDVYKLKKKLVESQYPITITEI